MNVPQGNAIALQQLRPIEDKTGDILSGYLFQLVKDKKADEAAKAKQAADNNKTWFDAYKELKIDPTVTASMYQDTSNKLFLETKDFLANAMQISQDPTLSEKEKTKLFTAAQNRQSQYNMYRATMQNEKALAEYYKGNEDIANGTAFQLSDDIGFRAALDSHSFTAGYDDNGNIVFKIPISPVSNKTRDVSLAEAVSLFSRRPEKDLLNKSGGLLDRLFSDGAKMKQSWSSDTTGYKTTSWEKFSQENGSKYFDNTFGTYSPNYIAPELKQYARQILKKDIENEQDFQELKKSVVDYMSTAVPTSYKVDAAKPPTININSGNNTDVQGSVIQNGTVFKKTNGGYQQVNNAVVLDFKDKGQFAAFKVRNSKKDKNGKYGYHIEYAILGKDKFGRSAYDRVTTATDLKARLVSLKYDPTIVDEMVNQNNPAFYSNYIKEDIGSIKYYGSNNTNESQQQSQTNTVNSNSRQSRATLGNGN